ncbi:MAG TPA: hypothetical protein VN023_09540 [Methylovorus sp.]|nr:hypothetical protein [Methylovorus sp.]
MTTSAITICNAAFLALGGKTISDFDENTDNALLAKNLYGSVRDWMLRKHPWNCAVKRVILSPDATPPAFGFSYQFTLPTDLIRILQVGDDLEGPQEYRNESRMILADFDVLKLRYVFRNDVEATWDASFIHAMGLAMKAIFAYPVTQSTSKEQLCMADLNAVLKEARSVDGLEDPPETFGDFQILNARYR